MPDREALRREIRDDPLGRDYVDMTNAQIAADLNTQYRTRVVSTTATVHTLLAQMEPPMAASVLDTLTAAADSDSVVKWAMVGFEQGGLDVGHPNTRAQLDGLVDAGVLSVEQAAALKAVGERPVSRAVEVWGWSVTERDVALVR